MWFWGIIVAFSMVILALTITLLIKNKEKTLIKVKIVDVLTDEEKKKLDKLVEVVLKRFQKQKISYFFAFGSLIGAIRHGQRIPWDDDVDILMNEKDKEKLVEGLKVIGKSGGTTLYQLDEEYTILYKDWGCPVKITQKDGDFPFIDIFRFYEKGDKIIAPPEQLKNGHIKEFEVKKSDIFPLKEAKFGKHKVKIPNKSTKILKQNFGNDVLTKCHVQFIHKPSGLPYDYKQQKEVFPTKLLEKKWVTPKIY